MGMGIDFLNTNSSEIKRMDLKNVLKKGQLPQKRGDILIALSLAEKLNIKINDTATIISSTASGGMAIHSFTVTGFVNYGIPSLDRNLLIADIRDVQYALNMDNSAGEILGFFKDGEYDDDLAEEVKEDFSRFSNLNGNELTIVSLLDQNGLREYLKLEYFGIAIMMGVFLLIMVVVLWNTGLMAGIRRYGEIGIRLAVGESKGELVRYMIYESIVIGFIGSFIGATLGSLLCYYLEVVGFDMSDMLEASSVLISPIMRANTTWFGFLIGFVPGILSVVLGTALAGIGIYQRNTSSLFKELES